MKIAISSTGKELTSEMDLHFGRSPYFIIVDTETMQYQVVDNAQSINAAHGAGISAAKAIIDNHAQVLITGICGPKAFQVLNQSGVRIITDEKGSVADAVNRFKKSGQ